MVALNTVVSIVLGELFYSELAFGSFLPSVPNYLIAGVWLLSLYLVGTVTALTFWTTPGPTKSVMFVDNAYILSLFLGLSIGGGAIPLLITTLVEITH